MSNDHKLRNTAWSFYLWLVFGASGKLAWSFLLTVAVDFVFLLTAANLFGLLCLPSGNRIGLFTSGTPTVTKKDQP